MTGKAVLSTLLVSLLSGLAVSTQAFTDPNVAPVVSGNWYKPVPLTTWQWQISGTVNTEYNVEIYDIDLFDSSAALIQQLHSQGKKVVCYFSAGSYEDWRPDVAQFQAAELGNPLDGWPGERWLDIRSSNVHNIMAARLDLAVQKGCDGVEPDNMDGYFQNTSFPLTANDQLAFNKGLANAAHTRGLSIGLKNDLDQIQELEPFYDFAVNEECFEYNECDSNMTFINANKAVLSAEYKDEYVNNSTARDEMCVDSVNRKFSTLILPLDLDDSFRLACQSTATAVPLSRTWVQMSLAALLAWLSYRVVDNNYSS